MLFGWGIFTNWSIINGKIYIGFTPSTIEGLYIYILKISLWKRISDVYI